MLSAKGKGNVLTILLTAALIASLPVAAYAFHPSVTLLDKDGDIIDPISGDNADKPFSTEWTCGSCHDYDEITKGYHFQTGWNVISDTFGVAKGRPWDLSPGMLGKWRPQSIRQFARKHNQNADQIDLTPYEFIGGASYSYSEPTCGSCHAGGGGLEFDRDGNRYDETLTENPTLRDSLDGDYYQSNWDKSGVVEADCFICHWPEYDFDAREEQFRMRNYRWAVVAGSGIGVTNGSVANGDEPTVTYNKRFFNADGTLVITPSWPPPDQNCMFCHGQSEAKKRGFSWNDIYNPDIHNQQDVSCTHCHTGGLDHQFAKGNALQSSVADSLDNTMKVCADCHSEGYLGASIPVHSSIRPSHLKRLACESCHIPHLGRSAMQGIDVTSGDVQYYSRPPGYSPFGDRATWEPDYEDRTNNKIYPINAVLTIWWANKDSDGIIYPLFEREAAAAWELYSDSITDDNGDGKPEINRDAEIMAGLKGVAKSLQGNKRFSQIQPVFVKAEKATILGSDGKLQQVPLNISSTVKYSINHNVAAARLALGSNGCSDCHASSAHFFKGKRVIDLFAADGKPVTQANGREFGCNPVVFVINSFHQRILSPVVSILIILVVFLVTVHYHSYGPKRIQFVAGSGEIQRFTLIERGVHLFRLIAFVFLAVTGLIIAFNWSEWQQLLFRSPQQMLWVHIISGFVFIITTLAGIKIWFKDALFASYDRDWVKRIGGYLGYKGEVPAGRFNAGQKMFYWYTTTFGLLISITGLIMVFRYAFELSVICLTATVHNLVGFILIAGVLAHAYLGTVANPGTWRVLVDGWVTREWAKHHHPNWYRKVMGLKGGLEAGGEEKQNGSDDKNGGEETK